MSLFERPKASSFSSLVFSSLPLLLSSLINSFLFDFSHHGVAINRGLVLESLEEIQVSPLLLPHCISSDVDDVVGLSSWANKVVRLVRVHCRNVITNVCAFPC